MRQILVADGEKRALCELFSVSYPTVRSALAFKTQSHLAYRIRKAAMERGGIEVEPVNKK